MVPIGGLGDGKRIIPVGEAAVAAVAAAADADEGGVEVKEGGEGGVGDRARFPYGKQVRYAYQ